MSEHTEYCQSVHGPAQMRGVFDCDICAAYMQGKKDAAADLWNSNKTYSSSSTNTYDIEYKTTCTHLHHPWGCYCPVDEETK